MLPEVKKTKKEKLTKTDKISKPKRTDHLWKKGQSGCITGRPKGCLNKFTTLKQAFINAFVNVGGEEALVDFYQNYKNRKAFFSMVASMLPKDVQLSGTDGAPLPSQTPVIVFCDGDGKSKVNESVPESPEPENNNG